LKIAVNTNYTFAVSQNSEKTYAIYLYYNPFDNHNNSFSLKRIQDEKGHEEDYDPPSTFDIIELHSKCHNNTIQPFLNKNNCTLIFVDSKYKPLPSSLTFKDILTEFVKYLPHRMKDSNDRVNPLLRINDTFVKDDKTNVDADGYRIPYPNDKKLVEQIMSMFDA